MTPEAACKRIQAILLDAKPGYEYDSRTKDDWPTVRVTYAMPVEEGET